MTARHQEENDRLRDLSVELLSICKRMDALTDGLLAVVPCRQPVRLDIDELNGLAYALPGIIAKAERELNHDRHAQDPELVVGR